MMFVARNCMLLSKSSLTLEEVSQALQQNEVEGRRTEFHKASSNSEKKENPYPHRIGKLVPLSFPCIIQIPFPTLK